MYKYCHPDRVDILKNRMIRFSPPLVLNDPFELSPYIKSLASTEFTQEIMTQAISELLLEYPILKTMPSSRLHEVSADWLSIFLSESTRSLVSNGLQNKLNNYGVLCLTETRNNLLMWSHYADSHQGFVIEFNPANDFFCRKISGEDMLRHLRKVSYSMNRPAINLSQETGENILFTKSEEWAYEEEWRMLMPLKMASTTIESPESSVHLFRFPSQAIRSVIFGCRIKKHTQEEILKALDTEEMRHVKTYKSTINQQHYKIDCIEFFR